MSNSVILVDFVAKRSITAAAVGRTARGAAVEPAGPAPMAALLGDLRSGYSRMSANSYGMHYRSAELARLSARLHEDLRSLLADTALLARAMATGHETGSRAAAEEAIDFLVAEPN